MDNQTLVRILEQSRLEYRKWAHLSTRKATALNRADLPEWWSEIAIELDRVDGRSHPTETIIGAEGASILAKAAANYYWYWRIVSRWAETSPDGETHEEQAGSLQRVITGLQGPVRKPGLFPIRHFLEGNITPPMVCEFTSSGLILWDPQTMDWALNPIFFSAEEIEQESRNRPRIKK